MRFQLRYFLPAYLIVYCGAAFGWRSYVVWKRTGVNPIVFEGSDDAPGFIGRSFLFLLALVVVVVLAYSFWPKVYQYAVPIGWLEYPWSSWTGLALLVLSFVGTVLAQAQMGESWRIGIDARRQTPLVNTGVFGLSRNPIFLGVMLTLLGLFLVIPNALTLLAFVLGVVLIQTQVRLEEEFLARTREGYAEYRRRVRRWL